MPGRSYNLNSYRLNYQGQESTPGTNWQAFELRLHNSDLGRWFAPDPAGQHYSPYISMGNNPVSGIDPDGGYVFVPRDLSPSGVRNFWMWRNMMGQYRSQRFMYEGEYRSGCEIENMMMRDFIEWRSDSPGAYDLSMGSSEYVPAFTGISHANYARTGDALDFETYIVTDPNGQERIALSKEEAEKLADQYGVVMQEYISIIDKDGNIDREGARKVGDPYFVPGEIAVLRNVEEIIKQQGLADINNRWLDGVQVYNQAGGWFVMPARSGGDNPIQRRENTRQMYVNTIPPNPAVGTITVVRPPDIYINTPGTVGATRISEDSFNTMLRNGALSPNLYYFRFEEGGQTMGYGSIPQGFWPNWPN